MAAMSIKNSALVSLLTLAALVGCSSSNPTSRGTFGGETGGSSGSGGSGGAAGGGGGGSGYTGYSGQGATPGGFNIPDATTVADVQVNADAACAASQQDSTPIKQGIIIVFDNSTSMNCNVANPACTDALPGGASTRIDAVRNAINNFCAAPASADVPVGLIPFPSVGGDQCLSDYSRLTVPIATCQANATTLPSTLATLTPHMNTPTEQALTGAYAAAARYTTANPGHTVAVVLVTDGYPYACGNDTTGAKAATLAKAAFDGSPSVQTFVVGLGATTTLDAIALAGSGGATHAISSSADATQQILNLLTTVSKLITCDYAIPSAGSGLDGGQGADAGHGVDYGFVNVQTKIGDAASFDTILNVSDQSKCNPTGGGWYYDVKPTTTTNPTKIVLCPQTCDAVNGAPGSVLQVLMGCATKASLY
jgi:hypothetical protein